MSSPARSQTSSSRFAAWCVSISRTTTSRLSSRPGSTT
ncbi:hypothetical protein LINPERPRIM_LOCUS1286 [Linum perenne]